MQTSGNTLKRLCILLGAVVAVLLLAIVFLLGRQSGAKNNGGAGRSDSSPAVTQDATVPSIDQADAPDAGNDAGQPAQPTQAVTNAPAQDPNSPLTLDIDMTSGSLTFETGAAFDIRYDSSVIRVERNGTDVVIENDHISPSASERKRMDVVVTVPANHTFDDVEIELGAGKLITRALRTRTLELEMGAGSATLEELVAADSADIRNGAGAFTIKSGSLNNLTLQCGAGATQVRAALTGSSRVVAAVGAVDIQLDGRESDYTVAFQMGLGACYYNNEKIARGGAFGSGPNRVDISGGLGVMRVTVG